jgi:hypothetical protein
MNPVAGVVSGDGARLECSRDTVGVCWCLVTARPSWIRSSLRECPIAGIGLVAGFQNLEYPYTVSCVRVIWQGGQETNP